MFNIYPARSVKTKTIKVDRANDWELVCYLDRPGYNPLIPADLKTAIRSVIESQSLDPVNARHDWRLISDSPIEAKINMAANVRKMLSNMNITQFPVEYGY